MASDIRSFDLLSVTTILDSLDALVYVSDMETYELIFMNRYGEKFWGSWQGRRCFEVLQGQSTPCAFCNNDRLRKPDGTAVGVVVWEFQNTVTGRWYQCRDEAIPWIDGRTVRIEIAADITERKQLEEELRAARLTAETLARIDPLTALRNRRAFFDEANEIFRHARRFSRPMSVAIIDIDHFKRVNDNHGHFVGDRVLRQVADAIAQSLRDVDMAGRLGGEEFGVVLRETSLRDALAICERIRSVVESLDCSVDEGLLKVSCSIGVVGNELDFGEIDELLVMADRALYRAKALGRNRVEQHAGGDAGDQP